MTGPTLDPHLRMALIAGGAVCLLAGAGWAIFGPEIFITALTAGLASCF